MKPTTGLAMLFRHGRRCLIPALGLAVQLVSAAPLPPPLPPELAALQPQSLLPENPDATFAFRDRSTSGKPATLTLVNEPGVGAVLRGSNPNAGQRHYFAEVSWKSRAPVKKGDACLARFSLRVLAAKQESGEGALNFYFQRAAEPFDKSVQLGLTPGHEWTVLEIPFTAAQDFAADEAMIGLSFGQLPQTFELAGLEVIDFGRRIAVQALPRTRFSYDGREAGAAWRAAALKRIEKIRTAPLSIHVVDAAGQPISNAKIEVRLIEPDFIFGTAVSAHLLVTDSPTAAHYRQTLLELFDSVTIDNALKWRGWNGGAAQRSETLQAIDWLGQNHLRLRGHNLVWPGWNFTPAGVKETPDLAHRLPELITEHIRSVMAATKGRVYGWDVVNELVHERDYLQYFPESKAAEWFKLARELDPEAQLFINEYEMLAGASSPSVIAHYREIIERLRAAGAPIDGIGVQAHLGQNVRSPEKVLSDLNLLAAEGLPLQITEFDIETTDEALQADYTRDFLIACYSHPAVTGFTMWGFWEENHWKPISAMIRRDWSEKPNAAVWRELVLNTWRTRIDAITPAGGSLATRGHLGRYRLTVTRGSVVNQQTFTLTSTGAALTVRFPEGVGK